jgi:hypothetical protein
MGERGACRRYGHQGSTTSAPHEGRVPLVEGQICSIPTLFLWQCTAGPCLRVTASRGNGQKPLYLLDKPSEREHRFDLVAAIL